MRALKKCVNSLLSPFGFHISRKKKTSSTWVSDLRDAKALNMDVNDWLETKLGWPPALPILEEIVFPHLRNDSLICELGVGTGRHSRHLLSKIPNGEIYLVDNSPWVINFVKKYFSHEKRVHFHLCNGSSIPFINDSQIDLVFSDGTFITMNLGSFYLYSHEFYRILKPGGYCIIDFIDISTLEGQNHLETQSAQYWRTFTYHTYETVSMIFRSAGFEIIDHKQIGKSSYLICRKHP